MKPRILLSEASRRDRRAITAYTVERFGLEQARRLRRAMQRAVEDLARSPLLGRTCAELDPPRHAFRYFVLFRRFSVVYEPIEDGIRIARILHGARSLAQELERDAGET